MTESEINAVFDAHDALVRACVDGNLGFCGVSGGERGGARDVAAVPKAGAYLFFEEYSSAPSKRMRQRSTALSLARVLRGRPSVRRWSACEHRVAASAI